MSNDSTPPEPTSEANREYESALEALKAHRIIEITPIEGGFQVREACARHFSVSLTPEQLRELGQEILALADSAEPAAAAKSQDSAPAGGASEEIPTPAMKGKTITISPGIWQMRMTEEFQARLVRLGKKEPPKEADATKKVKPWIKP